MPRLPRFACLRGFDGVFKRLNPAWSPLLGWSNAELQARPFLDFVHRDDRAATLSVMAQLDAGGTTLSFEQQRISRDLHDGLARWIFPVQLGGPGRAPALKELAETGDTRPADPVADLPLYRIAQEALSNAAKHGAARHPASLNKERRNVSADAHDEPMSGARRFPLPPHGHGRSCITPPRVVKFATRQACCTPHAAGIIGFHVDPNTGNVDVTGRGETGIKKITGHLFFDMSTGKATVPLLSRLTSTFRCVSIHPTTLP